MSLLETLLRTPAFRVLDLDGHGRLLLRSNESGTFQLSELDGEVIRRLTDFAEPVTGAYVPGTRRMVVSIDSGGNEQHQLWLADAEHPPGRDVSAMTPLAIDPQAIHALGGVRRDGQLVSFASNRRNGVDLDLWVSDLQGTASCLWERGGYGTAGGFSPDGRWVAWQVSGSKAMDTQLWLIEIATGAAREVLPHADAAVLGWPAWLDDGNFLVSSNVRRDLQAVVRCNVDGDGPVGDPADVVLEDEWDLDCWASGDGSIVVVGANVDGTSRLELRRGPGLDLVGPIPLPHDGVAFEGALPHPVLADNGSAVAFSFTSPIEPGAVWRLQTGSLEGPTRVTPPTIGDNVSLVMPTRHRAKSFDGLELPVYLYRPPDGSGGDRRRVVVDVHGGPEGQSLWAYSAVTQALVADGWAVAVPNVRGSTGYGKRYYGLDDTTLRLDAVADLAAVHDWLATEGLDPRRAVLLGRSYGGYMVLAGLTFQPQLWAAGVDIVGISDLVTFLENTSPYRRAAREREYGSLEHDREFLESASPMRHIEQVVAPVFAVYGANDPRVPASEGAQLAAALRGRGVDCELVVYPDEGHGPVKVANQVDAYGRAMEWLDGIVRSADASEAAQPGGAHGG